MQPVGTRDALAADVDDAAQRLFVIGSRDDPALRRSVLGWSASTLLGTSLLLAAAATDEVTQAALLVIALLIDCCPTAGLETTPAA